MLCSPSLQSSAALDLGTCSPRTAQGRIQAAKNNALQRQMVLLSSLSLALEVMMAREEVACQC